MSILIDSYSESNRSYEHKIYGAYITIEGQTFTGNGGILNSVVFYLKKIGSPTGNAVAKIWNITGTHGTNGKPSGDPLATSDNFDVSTLTTSYNNITFSFTGTNKITLTNNTNYCVGFEFTGGDTNNAPILGIDNSSLLHAGNEFYYFSGWSTTIGYDCCFYVYGDSSPTTTGISSMTGVNTITF